MTLTVILPIKTLIWKFLSPPYLGREIRAMLTIMTNYEQAFEDLNSTSSKAFVEDFVKEVHLNAISQSTQKSKNF